MKEKWRAVKDYEDSYVVSNKARVRSLDRVIEAKNGQLRNMRGRVLKPMFNSQIDEPYVNLQRDGNSHFVIVLRLQIEVFNKDEIDFSVTRKQLELGWPDNY